MAQEKYLGENGLKRLVGLVKEDLGTKANIDGSYDGMQVGSAKQIVSPTGITDTTPYVFRTTCGETSISGGDEQLASLKAIRGNTIAWNQCCENGNFEDNSTWSAGDRGTVEISNNVATVTCTYNSTGESDRNHMWFYGGGNQKVNKLWRAGHKYLVCFRGKTSVASKFWFIFGGAEYTNVQHSLNTTEQFVSEIVTAKQDSSLGYIIGVRFIEGFNHSGDKFFARNFRIYDLTRIDLENITSFKEFSRLYPKGYYPFNPGEIRNVKTKGLKTIGYNAFDGKWTGTTAKVSANFIKVIPGQTYTLEALNLTTTYKILQQYDGNKTLIKAYYLTNTNEVNSITLQDNACYVKLELRFANATDIPLNAVSFHLTWSGSRTGYAPHEEHILHIDTAQYFPDGMNGIGGVYDELTPKHAIQRFAKVDLGTLEWSYNSVVAGQERFTSHTLRNFISKISYINIKCAKYETVEAEDVIKHAKDKIITNNDGYIQVYDSSYTDATTFKQAMSGVTLIYELATPEITEIPQVRDNHWEIKVDDYGTEEWLFPDGDEIPVPVGHETLYMDNLVDKLRNLPEPSEYQEVVDKVNAPKLLSDIVDADGNKRFQYVPLELGAWFTECNVQNGFAFYSINGHSFRIVAGGVIPSGTTLPTSGKNFINEFKIPKWLADKIFFMDGSQWGESQYIVPLIVPKATRKSNIGEVYTTQIDIGGYLSLKGRYRSGTNDYLITSSIGGISLTTAFDSYFRFEWNLIIN